MTITTARWCSDSDENSLSCGHSIADTRRESEAPFPHVIGDEVGQARFKDWNCTAVQYGYLFLVVINTGYVVAKISETSAGDKPDIAAANHRNLHQSSLPSCVHHRCL